PRRKPAVAHPTGHRQNVPTKHEKWNKKETGVLNNQSKSYISPNEFPQIKYENALFATVEPVLKPAANHTTAFSQLTSCFTISGYRQDRTDLTTSLCFVNHVPAIPPKIGQFGNALTMYRFATSSLANGTSNPPAQTLYRHRRHSG
ncbi:hypothetical protein L9F63_020443, partial [Diploptera punctata]